MVQENKPIADEEAEAYAMSAGEADFEELPEEIAKEEGELSELFKIGLLAIVFALVIRTFAYEPFNIPSGSMLPTLQIGDYLFVSKYSYGYSRYSFPFGLADFDGRIMADMPERGDIAVFKKPCGALEVPCVANIDYIKRIIGLPGDTVQMIDGVLHINGEAVPREFKGQVEQEGASGEFRSYTEYTETLPNGVKHTILELSDHEELDQTRPITVPKGFYFAMGDNRDSSLDSRALGRVGLVPAENLVGRAEMLFFSMRPQSSLLHFWKWSDTIRFDRIFATLGN